MIRSLLILLLVSSITKAEARSMLEVRSTDTTMRVSIAIGDKYFIKRQSTVLVDNIPAGTYELQIFTPRYNRRGKAHDEVIFDSSVYMISGYVTLVSIDPYSGAVNQNLITRHDYIAKLAQEKRHREYLASKLEDLKKKVATLLTDTQKLEQLKSSISYEQVSTAQVAEMMDWFTFEASKVDFAKWAYKITVDKEYYSDLENKFSYKASQDELDKFIKQ